MLRPSLGRQIQNAVCFDIFLRDVRHVNEEGKHLHPPFLNAAVAVTSVARQNLVRRICACIQQDRGGNGEAAAYTSSKESTLLICRIRFCHDMSAQACCDCASPSVFSAGMPPRMRERYYWYVCATAVRVFCLCSITRVVCTPLLQGFFSTSLSLYRGELVGVLRVLFMFLLLL